MATKTGKAAVAAQRTERYANRNPRRLESQISDLQALKESQGGKLSARDQKQLDEAEKDVARVKKAREALGDKAPTFNQGRGRDDSGRGRGDGGRGRGGYGGLGKRAREQEESSGGETDESVRRIPWPKDTPPPIPRQQRPDRSRHSTNANSEPLGAERRLPARAEGVEQEQTRDEPLPARPAVRTTYESARQVRDLKKEATARFVPAAVRRKIDATRGKGGVLLEEEEVERLKREGYGVGGGVGVGGFGAGGGRGVIVDAAPVVSGEEEDALRRLRDEEERFSREMEIEMVREEEEEGEGPRGVRMEEVSDEDL